jgi:hypothetical protein
LIDEFEKDPTGKGIKDLYLSSKAIYWSIGLSLVYSLLYIYLMSVAAEYIAWTMIAFVQLGLLAGSATCILSFMYGQNLPLPLTED